ncbi:P-loop NTPase fold protein, partial [Providencia sp. wls1950]|uniref:P-loop NTPase fold protein n=1 Tax=Providencia sp. wls1950 TaxID=2675147 RepID=UPI0012B5BBD2
MNGDNYSILKKQIQNFLANQTARGMLLYGDWGCGKTHIINEIINDGSFLDSSILQQCSYVSLYSVDNIQMFRDEVKANKNKFSKSLKNSSLVTEVKLNLPILSIKLNFKNNFSESFSNTLIIIDDFERKCDTLKTSDVLGVLNGMTLSNGGKFIVISNVDKLDSESKKYIKENKDKLFSSLIEFNSDVDSAIKICEKTTTINIPDLTFLDNFKKVALQSNIKNVRVLHAIMVNFYFFNENILRELKKDKYKQPIIDDATMIIFVICYLNERGEFITCDDLSYLLDEIRKSFISSSNEDINTKKQKDALRTEYSDIYELL